MRKLSLKALTAMLLAGAAAFPAFASDKDDSSVGVSRVRKAEPARLETAETPVAKKVPVKTTGFTMTTPIHTTEPSGHPALEPMPERAYGGSAYGNCAGNCAPRRFSSPIEAWISGDETAATYPPDYGWNRPVKRPVLNRVPVSYYQMNPQYLVGDPRAFQGAQQFPMVYMPTDTTQLGYYYQRTWQWQPNPNMIPAPPWPSTWHRRECPEFTARQQAEMMSAAGQAVPYGPAYAPYYGPAYPVQSQVEAAPYGYPAPPAPAPLKPAPVAPGSDLPPKESIAPPALKPAAK